MARYSASWSARLALALSVCVALLSCAPADDVEALAVVVGDSYHGPPVRFEQVE